MKLHVVSLPHTQTTRRFLHCAYTMKVVKFCKMMLPDCEVVLYAGDENDAPCTEHVPLFTEAEREQRFGKWDTNNLFANVDWSPDVEPWRTMNANISSRQRSRASCEITSRSRI